VMGLLSRDDGGKSGKGEMDAREAISRFEYEYKHTKRKNLRNQVGLEFIQVDVQRSIESQ